MIKAYLPTLCFSFFSDETAVYRSGNGYDLLDSLSDNVYVSLVGSFDFSTYAGGFALDMYHKTGGRYFDLKDLPLGEELIKYIFDLDEMPEITKEYPIITSAGLVNVELAKPITADYFDAAKNINSENREDYAD